ncbi:MAG TPA: DUF4190 domain-containing protein [Candidatus Limnocylindrales bacterium]|nr:DUF4190 domain-containing protein [Candidatus Limnocylindrales bacterium]
MSEQPQIPRQPQPYPPPYNLYAILSLIFSVAVFPPVGIYLGYKAKEEITRTGERGIELAQVGIVVGWIFTSLYAVFLIVWCAFATTIFGAAGFNGFR